MRHNGEYRRDLLCKADGSAPCQSKVFIDPFEIWAGAESDSDLKQLVWAKYDQNRDTEKLAQWFRVPRFRSVLPKWRDKRGRAYTQRLRDIQQGHFSLAASLGRKLQHRR
jgi:hypothetical protein